MLMNNLKVITYRHYLLRLFKSFRSRNQFWRSYYCSVWSWPEVSHRNGSRERGAVMGCFRWSLYHHIHYYMDTELPMRLVFCHYSPLSCDIGHTLWCVVMSMSVTIINYHVSYENFDHKKIDLLTESNSWLAKFNIINNSRDISFYWLIKTTIEFVIVMEWWRFGSNFNSRKRTNTIIQYSNTKYYTLYVAWMFYTNACYTESWHYSVELSLV